MRLRRSPSPVLCCLGLAACGAAHYAADADAEVANVLGQAHERDLGQHERNVLRPEREPAPPVAPPANEPPAEPSSATPPPPPALSGQPPRRLDLQAALATAVTQNREFLARKEGLYESGLSIALTRFQFGPQFAAAVNYLWPRSEGGAESHQAGSSVTASQRLPTGGQLDLDAGLTATWPFGPGSGEPSYGTSTGIRLTQPLLRGAGRDIAWEPLTQAERNLTYAIRDFELFREDFSIRIARRYFELVSERKTLANEDANYDNAVFDRKKAEALQLVGRNSEQDVFRARRREIEAKDQLLNARAAYDRAVDSFKIELGLPTTTVIELAEAEPDYLPIEFAAESAIRCARVNRLDLITERQRVEDVERGLRIAENGLLPDLSLTASFGTAGAAGDLGDAAPDEWNSSIGLSMSIPLQQKAQRNAYRSSLISLEQAKRGLQQREDQLDLDIRDAVRQLHTFEERIGLQLGQIEQEQRAVTVMEIRYESGDAENRDLFEARQALVNARNALIRLKADHFIARLNLLKDVGIFSVDDKGMWR